MPDILRRAEPPHAVAHVDSPRAYDPLVTQVVLHGAQLVSLYDQATFSEGPVWWPARDRLVWSEVKGRRVLGLPIPRITYSWCNINRAMNPHGLNFMGEAVEAAGGRHIGEQTDDINHLYVTARMGDDPTTSVVDGDCRSWDSPNLWVCDGSVFPTTGGVNPSLTIQAIALPTADRIKAMARTGVGRNA